MEKQEKMFNTGGGNRKKLKSRRENRKKNVQKFLAEGGEHNTNL